jgi:hypothetical protein
LGNIIDKTRARAVVHIQIAPALAVANVKTQVLRCESILIPFPPYWSKEKIRFQSFFMLITTQAFFVASSSSSLENVPT